MEVLEGFHARFRGLFDSLEIRLKQDRKQAEDDLEAHFHAVETVLFKTALPSISPRVKYSLQRFCDVSALLAALKQPAGDAGDSDPPRNKLEVWQDLKVLSFARAAAAVSSLAVVSMQMRLMLTVLSRQLFLERAGEGVAGPLGALGGPRLGIEAQEFFLSLAERGFVRLGMGAMVERLKTTARETVGSLALGEAMDAPRATTLAALGDGAARGGAATPFCSVSGLGREREKHKRQTSQSGATLCCPRRDRRRAFNGVRRGARPAGAGGRPSWRSSSHGARGATAASTRAFADALGDATARAWDRFAADALDALFPHRGGGHEDTSRDAADAVPVAKLVPAVSNLAGQTLADPRGVFGAVASCPKVQELAREMW